LDRTGRKLRPWVKRYMEILTRLSDVNLDPQHLPNDPWYWLTWLRFCSRYLRIKSKTCYLPGRAVDLLSTCTSCTAGKWLSCRPCSWKQMWRTWDVSPSIEISSNTLKVLIVIMKRRALVYAPFFNIQGIFTDRVWMLYGRIAKTLAGKPEPSLGFGKLTTTRAPDSGTLSRLASSSIW
jgi:hypothetical protein